MSLFSVFVVNTAPGCDNFIEQQISADTCNSYIIRITPNTNALGPFDVYASPYPVPLSAATLYYSAQTRTQMLNGVVIQLGPCVTPSPTPTPTLTPTPATPTPTPTNTETPTNTPTNTETPTNTPTPSSTPGSTPTQTPTNTETPTQTPTPSPTTPIFEIFIMDQEGNIIETEDGDLLILQELPTGFFVSSGETSPPICIDPQTLSQTIYSPTNNWDIVVRFFSDSGLNTPFNGNNYWYTNSTDSLTGYWQIGTDGFVIGNKLNPC